jgi:S-adenosylmethionine hydrolase
MLKRPIITLTTDFGLKDPFVGIMKGVISGINPEAEIIDISHGITPQNIFEASLVISMSYGYFPPSTIHVAVVDPGVGGSRRALLVVTRHCYFIGPDNGIFTPVFEQERRNSLRVIHISSPDFFLSVKGPTFHGRDIFAPVAAWLSKGVDNSRFGETVNDFITLPLKKPELIDNRTISGEVIYIDKFGNAITNIKKDAINNLCRERSPDGLRITYKDRLLNFVDYYGEKADQELSAILNSFEYLELFIYKGDASDSSDIRVGDKVLVSYVK